MIRRLVLRSLRHRPGRSLLLLAGYALGVGVTVALLSIGSALVQGSRDRTLLGGGDLTVIPVGLDLETLRTGGASSLYFSIDQAPFLYRQVLAGPRFGDRLAAAAPWIDDEVLYLELPDGEEAARADSEEAAGPDARDDSAVPRPGARRGERDADDPGRVRPVSAGGRIPGLSRRLGAPADVSAGAWRDVPADRRWAQPDDSSLYAEIDAFHLPPPEAAGDTSWAEWHYFNVLLPEGEGWLYLTYMVAGDVPDGRWGGRLLATLVTRGDGGEAAPGAGGAGRGGGTAEAPGGADRYRTRQFRRDVPAGSVRFSLARPDLRIGGSTVSLGPGGRYRLEAEIPAADDGPTGDGTPDEERDAGDGSAGGQRSDSGPPLRLELVLEGDRRSHLPPLDVAPGDLASGYVVPMLDARAAGRLCVGSSCRELEGAPAYHDHNWGRWSGVTWDWGHARVGSVRLLYGGVRRDVGAERPTTGLGPGSPSADADPAAAGRSFLFVTDSLGFAGLFPADRLEHRWREATGARAAAGRERRAGAGPRAPRRRPEGLTVGAVRGRDTIRLRATVGHARSTRREGADAGGDRPLLFWQMRGEVRLTGRLLGRTLSGTGEGFFETWAPGVTADADGAGREEEGGG